MQINFEIKRKTVIKSIENISMSFTNLYLSSEMTILIDNWLVFV